jgi:hypothetical protein
MFLSFIALLDPDPDTAEPNQCGFRPTVFSVVLFCSCPQQGAESSLLRLEVSPLFERPAWRPRANKIQFLVKTNLFSR